MDIMQITKHSNVRDVKTLTVMFVIIKAAFCVNKILHSGTIPVKTNILMDQAQLIHQFKNSVVLISFIIVLQLTANLVVKTVLNVIQQLCVTFVTMIIPLKVIYVYLHVITVSSRQIMVVNHVLETVKHVTLHHV